MIGKGFEHLSLFGAHASVEACRRTIVPRVVLTEMNIRHIDIERRSLGDHFQQSSDPTW